MLLAAAPLQAATRNDGTITKRDVQLNRAGNDMFVSMDLILDGLRLAPNHQLFVTPVIESGDGLKRADLPTVIISGRNMHYVYLRSGETKATGKTRYNVCGEYYHKSGTPETIAYRQAIPAERWMLGNGTRLTLYVDTCGCGVPIGTGSDNPYLMPSIADRMQIMPFPTPDPTVRKPINHHGRSRVQFEVDKIELHDQPYRCKSGQLIDNRQQLQVIHDSITYALRDPNVEIESISICGYASPESPYEHNDYLATNRSRALSEYIGHRYNIPLDRCHYSSVVENWGEFREQVVAATDITEQQRADLLQLIDAPCYGPADYDAKETALKTDPRFAQLYKTKILPEWFPMLRCTQFDIRTQLKPLTPIQLRDVMAKTPELMSLDEIYLVACSYDHGSPEFLNAMAVALKYYPDDAVANANAAAVAIEKKDYAAAAKYLQKAGDTDDANVLRGILATSTGDIDAAIRYFEKAKGPEAERNLNFLK